MINFFNRTVLMHILFVTFFNLFVFHLQTDIISPLLLNASLLLVLTTDYSDWLVQVTELIDNWQWQRKVKKGQERFDFGIIVFTFGTAGLHNFFLALKFLTMLIF